MNENEMESELEYELMDMKLKEFARKLVEYPAIQNIPTNTSLKDYFVQVTQVIGTLIPFDHKGVGVSRMFEQVAQIAFETKLPEVGQSFRGRKTIDCKLPASVTVYLINELANTYGWPIYAEATTFNTSSHAYLSVRVRPDARPGSLPFSYDPEQYLLIDYESSQGIAIPGVETHSERTHDKVSEHGVTFETDLKKGLQNFDKQYYMGLEDRNRPKS